MSDQHPRVLLMAEAVTLAHVGRVLAVKKALVKYPVECHVAFDRRFERFTQGESNYHHLPSIEPQTFIERVNSSQFPYTQEELNRNVQEDLKLLIQLQPKLVIGDFRISLAISARIANIPYFSLTNGYWLEECSLGSVVPDHFLLRRLPKSVAKFLFKLLSPLTFYIEALPFNRMVSRYEIQSAKGSMLQVYTQADHRLIVEPPDWIPVRNASHLTFIGPVRWQPDVAKPDWLAQVDWTIPTIYVSVGSSGSLQLIYQVLAAVEGLFVQVIISGVQSIDRTKYSTRVYCAPFIANSDVLERAQIFISNGGSLSMVDALQFGKPVIGIISNYDQILNCAVMKLKGIGEGLIQRNLKIAELKSLISQFLNPSEEMQRQLKKSQAIFSQELPHQKLWAVVEQALNSSKRSPELE